MHSLIISIIALGLATVVTMATLGYMGDIIPKGRHQTDVTKYIGQAQQLKSAVHLKTMATGQPVTLADLQAQGALGSLPVGDSGESWRQEGANAVLPVSDRKVCEDFNAAHDIAGVPACGDPAYFGKVMCCE